MRNFSTTIRIEKDNTALLLDETLKNKMTSNEIDRFFELPLDMLCIVNMTGHFIKISKSLSQMIGYSEAELLFHPFSDFIVPEDQVRTEIIYNELKQGKNVSYFENRYRCKNGSVKWLSWNYVAVPAEGVVYAIARDVTEIKIAQLWQQQYTEQLEELLRQKDDSLRYARYLQHAVTPDIDSLHHVFPESFIYFAPKDIVSGDFFWMETLSFSGKPMGRDGELVIMAAADCTGHGVPAAMLTVMCSNALTKAVNEFGITEPGKILDKVCALVRERFVKSSTDIQDGMDISLCLYDKTTRVLRWSGANSPLYFTKDGNIHELLANKQHIGKCDCGQPFITHEVVLAKGDMIYLFSDGYASQFGGEKGKKFMSANLKKLLADVSSLDSEIQKKTVTNTFEAWKGSLEQVDDVTVVGIKV